MMAFLSALAYAWISHAIAYVLMPRSLSSGLRLRAIVLWAFAAFALFMMRDWLVVLVLVAFATFLVAPSLPALRAAFFMVAATCLPFYLDAPLPFPGINFLLSINNYALAAVVLLLPLFLGGRPKLVSAPAFSTLDLCLVMYVAYTAVVVGGAVNPTTGLRILAEQSLALALPYFALRYVIQSMDDIDAVLDAFLVAAIILGAITLVTTAKQWDFYWLTQRESPLFMPDLRTGLLRVQATASVHSLGYHLAAAVIVLQLVKGRLKINWLNLLALRFTLLVGMFLTNSRGAMVGLIIAWFGYTLIMVKSNVIRSLLLACALLGAFVGISWLLYGDTEVADVYGTINFRQELFRIGIAHVQKYPIFGDYDFYSDPAFQVLREGQGIIDITNLYLQILLHYGLLGAVLFFSVIVIPMASLLRQIYKLSAGPSYRRSAPGSGGPRQRGPANTDLSVEKNRTEERMLTWRRMIAAVVGMQAGWLFLVATTSSIGFTLHIGIVFAAISRALVALGADMIKTTQSAEITAQSRPGRLGAHAKL